MNMTSSLSKRLKMRRKPLSRRNSRSISLRRRYQAFLTFHGSARNGCAGPRDEAKIQSELTCFIAFIGAIHDESAAGGQVRQSEQQVAAGRRVAGLPGVSEKAMADEHPRQPYDFWGPSAAGSAMACGPFFLERRYRRDAP